MFYRNGVSKSMTSKTLEIIKVSLWTATTIGSLKLYNEYYTRNEKLEKENKCLKSTLKYYKFYDEEDDD
jgi:hypothetical protein